VIATRRQRIPWSWALWLAFPCGAEAFVEACGGAALTFTLWKFTHDPALLAFLGSINLAFNFLVAPLVAWQSDHIWTQWGRRLPFLIAGWGLLVGALGALPLAPNLWILLAVILLYHAAVDIGFTGPWPPLYFEIVPPAQRGRAIVIKRAAMIGAQGLFNLVLIGRFDDRYHLHLPLRATTHGLTFTGEQLIYAVGAGLVLAALVLVLGGIRETRPEIVRRAPFSARRYWRSLRDLQPHWPRYLLALSAVALGACLGQLQPLLITQQFGYSKQVFGNMFAIALAAEILIALPLLGFFADRGACLRLYQILCAGAALIPALFWGFIKFVAPHQVPTPAPLIVFMVAHSLVRTLAMLTVEPLFFDGVHPDVMGQMYSGLLVVRGLGGLLVLNGVGWWVKLYSFFVPCGDTMRYDYTSAYLYIALFGVLALAATILYAAKGHHLPGAAAAAPSAETIGSATPPPPAPPVAAGAASRPFGGSCPICPHANGM